MRIVARSITLLCLFNLIRGQQSEADDKSESELTGDSGWWSRRITKINGKVVRKIGLANEDNQRQGRRWDKEKTEIRDSRRRPRPFASVRHSNKETRSRDHRFESQRRGNVLNDKETTRIIVDSKVPMVAPSPILLPPYATPSPLYHNDVFAKSIVLPEWNNESSSDNPGKSSIASALERIYEITTFNSTNNNDEKVESNPSYVDYLAKMLSADNENKRLMDLTQETYVNRTRMRNDHESARSDVQNLRNSFYIYEKPGNEKITNIEAATNESSYPKSPRGNIRYQDNFEDDKSFMRKRTYLGTDRYEWGQRSKQRSNHFRFRDDSDTKVGSVPGIPGRDYPIHQEHTHHHLRNVVDRFPCPRTPKTHVYLADKASRCQIFYVCYGSKTGVPMVCPNGTLFSEPLQVCDWWYNVSC